MKYCPKCGNQLADADAFCNKCGCPQGNSVAQPVVASPVVKAVGTEQKEFGRKLEKAAAELDALVPIEKYIQSEREYIENVKSGKIRCRFFKNFLPVLFILYPGVPMLVCMLYGIYYCIFEDSETATIFFVTLGILLAIIILVIGILLAMKFRDKRQKQLKEVILPLHEKKMNEAIKKRNSALTKEFWQTMELIPDDYRYGFALHTLAGYFKAGRTDTLKEALNLFETEKHQWNMERIQIQQAEQITNQLNSIRQNTAVSAGANVANVIYTLTR